MSDPSATATIRAARATPAPPEDPDPPTEAPATPPSQTAPEVVPTPTRPTSPAPPDPVPADEGPSEPEVAKPTYPVGFFSRPMGAEVYVDGRLKGKTPLSGLELTQGTHEVRLQQGAKRIEKTITVGRRHPKRYSWVVSSQTWKHSQ